WRGREGAGVWGWGCGCGPAGPRGEDRAVRRRRRALVPYPGARDAQAPGISYPDLCDERRRIRLGVPQAARRRPRRQLGGVRPAPARKHRARLRPARPPDSRCVRPPEAVSRLCPAGRKRELDNSDLPVGPRTDPRPDHQGGRWQYGGGLCQLRPYAAQQRVHQVAYGGGFDVRGGLRPAPTEGAVPRKRNPHVLVASSTNLAERVELAIKGLRG